jgi:RNA polymerase sigma-70 factor (ECF subfamily)
MSQAVDPLRNPEPLIRRVYAYVAYRIGSGADAEDVTSATFERAVRYRDSYRGRRGEPIAWLLGIADRCILDLLGEEPALRVEVPELAGVGDAHADTLVRIDLQRALASLSPRDRELVALRYGADLTAREIARLVGVSTNGTEVALHRALRRLRDRLEPPEPASRRPITATLDLESRST